MSRKVLALTTELGGKMANACAPLVRGKDAAEVAAASVDLVLATLEALGYSDTDIRDCWDGCISARRANMERMSTAGSA